MDMFWMGMLAGAILLMLCIFFASLVSVKDAVEYQPENNEQSVSDLRTIQKTGGLSRIEKEIIEVAITVIEGD